MKPINIFAVSVIVGLVSFGGWAVTTRPLKPVRPTFTSTYIRLSATAADSSDSVTLSIGVSHRCNAMAERACPIDNLIELNIGGIRVATIAANVLTPRQIDAMKKAMQAVVDGGGNPHYDTL
jgi:hypothetical protein